MGDFVVTKRIFGGVSGELITRATAKADRLIVLLHGYQGDAESNRGFGIKLAAADSRASVLVFDGLQEVPAEHNPHVRQWWDLPPFEGRTYSYMPWLADKAVRPALDSIVAGAESAAAVLNRAILTALKELNLKKGVLCGISQGGITAFEMALFRSELRGVLIGLVIIGSGIAGADRLSFAEAPKIPVLLVAGSKDDTFPRTVDYFTAAVLREKGVPVRTAVADSGHFGLEHAGAAAVGGFVAELA